VRLAFEVEYLDCCTRPLLDVAKRLTTDDHDRQSLCRCESCGAWWLYRFYEYIHFDVDLPDDQITWFVRLTEDEAQAVLRSDGYPRLPPLAERPCFRMDERGIAITDGFPQF